MATVVDMIQLLELKKSAVAKFQSSANGPVRPIYAVKFADLIANPDKFPQEIAKLISSISTSSGPIDKSAKKTSRNDETIGAMRQIHSNRNPTWLPRLDRKPASGGGGGSREQAYDYYTSQNKKQTNDNGGSNVTTGYVEFTASDAGTFKPEPPRRARIVFDYVNSRIFFSPQHYHSWEIVGNDIKLISGNESSFLPKHPSAFYWITDITTSY